MTSTLGSCPPEAPPEATVCASRVGGGVVRGLGPVSERYTYFIVESACGTGDRVLETTARLEVAGKGELQLALARIEDCLPSALDATGPFTVTGGTGIYAGASGSGVVVHQAQYTPSGSAGTDTWTGTLDVPGLEFDLTPPVLSGTANKTVRAPRRAKRVRVSYRVRATDQVDGSRPVVCKPRSGSRFRIGRTVVKCSATDNSGNSATGRFSIVVKRSR